MGRAFVCETRSGVMNPEGLAPGWKSGKTLNTTASTTPTPRDQNDPLNPVIIAEVRDADEPARHHDR